MTNRITDHRDLMFPVRTVGVFAELRDGVEASLERIPGKKAIVNCTNDSVISVVSNDYQVVTNRDALDYGFRCCKAAFPDVPQTAWGVTAADAPANRRALPHRLDPQLGPAQVRFSLRQPAPGHVWARSSGWPTATTADGLSGSQSAS